MILYLSGNMPQLADPKKEKAFKERLHGADRPYHRLVTIFYPDQCETVIGLLRFKRRKKEIENCSETLSKTHETCSTSDLKSSDISEDALNDTIEIQEQDISMPAFKNYKQSTLGI